MRPHTRGDRAGPAGSSVGNPRRSDRPGRSSAPAVRLPAGGHPFAPGTNPRVNGQFSARFCVANAFLNGSSRLEHFAPAAVTGKAVGDLAARVHVTADSALDERGHSAVDLIVVSGDSEQHFRLDIAPGFPGNALSQEDHDRRLQDCLAAAASPLPDSRIDKLMESLRTLEELDDVTDLVADLISPEADADRTA
ncbi:hypothetical protein ACR6C2_36490 [Streptomyces sp. INA 01156]